MSEVHTETEQLRRIEEGIADLRVAIGKMETELPHLATKEMLANVEIRLIKWMIGTGVIAVLALSAQLWGAVQLLLRLVPK